MSQMRREEHTHGQGADGHRGARSGHSVNDPVCGMAVDLASATHHCEHGGRRYFFCSARCRARFRAAPLRYLSRSPAPEEKSTHAHAVSSPQTGESGIYTCPMHPEVRQQGPGACPRCGMALEPEVVAPPVTKTEWTCPMHPQIVREGPGSCPICGMALEPKTVTVDDANPELVDMSRR